MATPKPINIVISQVLMPNNSLFLSLFLKHASVIQMRLHLIQSVE